MRVGWKSPQKGTKFARHVRGSQSCPWTPKSDFLGVCVGGEFHITSTPPCPPRGVCRFPVQNEQSQFCVSRATLVPRLASPFPLSDQRAEQLLSLVELLFPHCGSGTTLALQCCPGDTQGRACGAEPGSRLTFEMEAAVSLVAGGAPPHPACPLLRLLFRPESPCSEAAGIPGLSRSFLSQRPGICCSLCLEHLSFLWTPKVSFFLFIYVWLC